MRVRVKICGITRAGDAEAAALAGADAIGMVFHPQSRRAVDEARAREIVAALPPFVSSVALFVDPAPERVREVLERVRPDLLQFHGHEDEPFCVQFGVPYIKALHLGGAGPADAGVHPAARALLLDTWDPAQAGGTGRVFDWSLARRFAARRLILAGGLEPGNVERAVRATTPWAVDVSSGVESAPGIKDARRMCDFIRAVRRAEAACEAAEETG